MRLRNDTILATLFLLGLVLAFMGSALWPGEGQALAGHDIRSQFLPWLSDVNEAIRAGRLPLWDSYHFAGYPFLSNPQIAFFYPPAWLTFMLPARIAISWYVAFHIWLAGVGMLLFVRAMKGTHLGALLAAVSFSFSGFFVARIWAGHISFIAAIAWLPWLLFISVRALRRADILSKALPGLPLGLIILSGHIASLVYVGLVWACFVFWVALSERRWHQSWRVMVIGSATGLALGAVQLLPFVQLSQHSARLANPSFEFATRFSLPPGHLFTLLIPNYYGEPTRIGYWGAEAFQELTYFAGALGLLGVLVAMRKPSRQALFYLALLSMGLLLALGNNTPLYEPMYRVLWPLRLVRAPGRFAILFVFGASALLGEIVACWTRLPGPTDRLALRKWLRLWFLVISASGVAALAAMAARYQALPVSDESNRLWVQMGGTAWALAVLLTGVGLLYGYLTHDQPGTRRDWFFAGALVCLALVDLWHFGRKQISLAHVGPHPLWTDAKQIIGESRARVLPWGVPIFDQNGAGEVGLHSVFGYNPIELQAPVALAASVPDPRARAYDVLAVAHVIAPIPQEQYTEGERPLTLIGQTDSAWVYRRSQTLPLVRLVTQAENIADRSEAWSRLNEPDFDPKTTAILDGSCALASSDDTASSARLVVQREGLWEITTSSAVPSVLIVSQTAYPGWRVGIDGQEAEPLVAYTALQAVCVPAGEHTVTWAYRPIIFAVGFIITLVTLFTIALAATVIRKRHATGV